MTRALALAILAAGAAQAADPITVRSSAIGPGSMIAQRNSAYGANRSPQVAWTPEPKAKSYAVVLDDPDAPGPGPFVHWLMWNIPADRTHLDEAAAPPAGAVLGRNGHGGSDYWGPHPPSGTHHYHLQVMALDRGLTLAPGADRAQLARAMRGHVIASGEIVGLFSAPR